jgi:NAD(P)H-hydrate epimerase
MNRAEVPILAIDLPSGLDCDTGEALDLAVRATRTVTFVAEKAGFANPDSREYTGEVSVADIGCPKELTDEVRNEIID